MYKRCADFLDENPVVCEEPPRLLPIALLREIDESRVLADALKYAGESWLVAKLQFELLAEVFTVNHEEGQRRRQRIKPLAHRDAV